MCSTAISARSETVYTLRPTIMDDEAQAEPVEAPAVTPSLTITPEDEQAPRKTFRQVTDPYAVQGVKLGGLTLYPSLEAGTLYTSNVAKASTDAHSDIGLRLRPSLRFESDWVRHSWTGTASGDFIDYLSNGKLNSRQVDANSKFRLDIRHTTRAEFEASYVLAQTGAENSEVPDTAIGNRTDHTLRASAAIIHDFGALEGRAKLGIERQIYEDVALSGGGTLRLSYTDLPTLKPFAEFTYEPRFHDEKLDRNGLRRDSQGLAASVGVTLDRGPIWSGEAALVYALRDYEDSALTTIDAFGVDGNLTWRPTDLTSVLMTAATTLNESSSATSSGTKTWSGRIDVTHELRENLKLLGGLGLALDKVSSGTDKTLTSNLSVEWQLDLNLAWTAGYDGTWFWAASSSDNYDDQRLMTGIVFRR
jgi:hypothetical protein